MLIIIFLLLLLLFLGHCANGTTTIIDSSDDSDEDEDDDSDEVTDYLEKLNIEVTNIDHDINNHQNGHGHNHNHINGLEGSEDGGSAKSTSAEASPRQVDSDGPASPVIITTRLASNSEQDTISDESGYSEESNPSAKDHADFGDNLELEEEEEEEENCDLTVKGVLISDFSPMEKLKYLQRSQSTQQRVPPPVTQLLPQQQQQQQQIASSPPVVPPAVAAAINNPIDIFQNKVPEFCINI